MSEALELTAMFKALGDPTRLRIFEFLCACCCPVAVEETGDVRPVSASSFPGPTVGEVCCQVLGTDKIPSSVSFHLKELRLAGLITMERRGKNMICGISREAVNRLAAYFSHSVTNTTSGDCCE